MSQEQDRLGRTQPQDRRKRRRLRTALALVATALAALAVVAPTAGAATGGASGYEASADDQGFGPLRYAGASWYGPGLWGRSTACGHTLRPTTIGVAHKTLPCGTLVRFVFRGRSVVAPVIDRGPYIRGRAWDLTAAASAALGFESVGVGRVGYQLQLKYARG